MARTPAAASTPASLVPAGLRACLPRLQLRARRAAGGDGLGLHASRHRGAGLEFAQYRAYEPGDEPRRIDWKLFARSDRYFVREAERDSPLCAWLLVDATASMRQADRDRPALSKLAAAKTLAACVVELALRQGDRFGLVALGGASRLHLAPAAGARARDRCCSALSRLEAHGAAPAATSTAPLLEALRGDALVVVLSDFFEEATIVLAERLARAGCEVLTIQIIGADEREFPFGGSHRFVDPEGDAERVVDAGAVRAGFLARFGAARVALARRFAAHGIRHVECMLDAPLERPLQRLFGATRA
jgi:uncharacterized protein (DUF58 family)